MSSSTNLFSSTTLTSPIHIVVGGGPGGIFCTLELLSLGHRVILIEKGDNKNLDSSLSSTFSSSTNGNSTTTSTSSLLNYFPPQISIKKNDQDTWTNEMTSENIFSSSKQKNLFLSRSLTYPQSFQLGGNSNINAMLTLLPSHPIYSSYILSSFPQDDKKLWTIEQFKFYSQRVLDHLPLFPVSSDGYMMKFIEKFLIHEEINENNDDIYGNFYNINKFHYLSTINKLNGNKRFLLSSLLLSNNNEILSKYKDQLIIINNTEISLLIINNDNKVIGVKTNNNQEYYSQYNGEIILSCGTLFSYQIIKNSLNYYNKNNQKNDSNNNFIKLENKLGKHLVDHPILPVLYIGNWSGNWKKDTLLPFNSVHGWLFLDYFGRITKDNPKTQLVFVDGYIIPSLGYLALPSLPSYKFYQNYIRNPIIKIIKSILLFFPYIHQQIYGILISIASPKSKGNIQNDHLYNPNFFSHSDDFIVAKNSLETIRLKHKEAVLSSFPKFLSPIVYNLPFFFIPILSLIIIIINFLIYFISFGYINIPSPFFSIELIPSILPFSFFIRYFSATYMHPVGSLPMKSNENNEYSILESDLTIKHIKSLRICDGSVLNQVSPGGPVGLIMTIGIAAAHLAYKSSELNQKNDKKNV